MLASSGTESKDGHRTSSNGEILRRTFSSVQCFVLSHASIHVRQRACTTDVLVQQPAAQGEPAVVHFCLRRTHGWLQLMNNPERLQEMMRSPIMQSMMDNPELMRNLLNANPVVRQVSSTIPIQVPSHSTNTNTVSPG
jgi:hypothetical protein